MRLWILALISRLAVLTWAILVDYCISDHAASGVESLDGVFTSSLSASLLQPFTRWDAAHYLNIALHGYVKDYQFAFYPLFPSLISWCSAVPLPWLSPMEASILLILLWNIIAFVLSALVLSALLRKMGLSEPVADLACLCFVFNPASVFFSSIYTESTYALLAWSGMLFWDDSFTLSTACLLLASCTRSNGSLNTVIIAGMGCQALLKDRRPVRFIGTVLKISISVLSCILPGVLFNLCAYQQLCQIPAAHKELCGEGPIQTPYGYLQEKYWNVGFLKFYELKQIPNFFLGLPVLVFGCFAVIYHLDQVRSKGSLSWWKWFQHPATPWVVHMILVMLLVLGWAHVQIATRLLCSACPLVFVGLGEGLSSTGSWRSATFTYLHIYILVGVALHCNFYPFT